MLSEAGCSNLIGPQEEDAVIDESGRTSWLLKHQTEHHWIR
ncbi:MAG TPA: hypothetical protein VNO24_00060 [Blastocatellia bacterium]|nr:hypothetical protein [Blastocatellia bacterium]